MASKYVRCIAVFADGTEQSFSVLEDHLRRGDHVLRILATESQRGGVLKPGELKDVYRAPPGQKFP